MFQVVLPNSTENATFIDNLKWIQPPEQNPSQQHKSAKQMLSQAHLIQIIKGFLSVPGVLELEHMTFLNWLVFFRNRNVK